jgi:hypothetical protein
MTTEQEWLGNSPYTHPSMPGTSYRDYIMALPRPMAPADYFVADENAPITALPPIIVTVQEEINLKYGPRKPFIHWEDVPATSENSALETIMRQAMEMRAKGIEPVFTLNGKVVDLAGPIDPHNL